MRKLNNENARYHVAYLKNTIDTYCKEILPQILPISDAFYTYEFQKRGTLHCHALLWLDSDKVPTVRNTDFGNKNERERLEEYLDSIITAEMPPEPKIDDKVAAGNILII